MYNEQHSALRLLMGVLKILGKLFTYEYRTNELSVADLSELLPGECWCRELTSTCQNTRSMRFEDRLTRVDYHDTGICRVIRIFHISKGPLLLTFKYDQLVSRQDGYQVSIVTHPCSDSDMQLIWHFVGRLECISRQRAV